MADKESKLKGLMPDFENAQAGRDLRAFDTGVQNVDKSMKAFDTQAKELGSQVGSVGGNVGSIINQIKQKSNANAMAYPTPSLIKAASKNVFEFPVFVSSSVPIDFATAINSLLEQVYASYVQMAISQNPVVSAKDMKAGNPFRRLKSDTSKYLEYTDPTKMPYAHDACHNVITTEDAVVEFDMIDVDNNIARIVTESLDYRPLSEFDHFFTEADGSSADDDDDASSADDIIEAKANIEEINKKRMALLKKKDALAKKGEDLTKDEQAALDNIIPELAKANKELKNAYVNFAGLNLEELEKSLKQSEKDAEAILADDSATDAKKRAAKAAVGNIKKQLREERDKYQKRLTELDEKFDNQTQASVSHGLTTGKTRDDIRKEEKHVLDVKKAKFETDHQQEKYDREVAKHKADMKAKAPQMMDETKINKLNSMKPLMMTVSMRVMDNKDSISDLVDYVVGVKTHCRMIDADILPEFAEYPSKTMNIVSRKARWRAGEIKFVDYLFSRKEKKQAAYDSRDPKRKWYHRLYNLAHVKGSSKIARKITGSGNADGLIPDVTLVITKADVDMVESVNGIDLLNGSKAASICKELFLMAMVVVDTDAQSIKMLLPDISSSYEVHSLASVNKQLATLDTSNSVSREVSRMMRER